MTTNELIEFNTSVTQDLVNRLRFYSNNTDDIISSDVTSHRTSEDTDRLIQMRNDFKAAAGILEALLK